MSSPKTHLSSLLVLCGAVIATSCYQSEERTACDPRVETCPGVAATTTDCPRGSCAPCPEVDFFCSPDNSGGWFCEQQGSAAPPGEGWSCSEHGDIIACEREGSTEPTPASGWVCSEYIGPTVVCRRHSYIPDIRDAGVWSCYFEGIFRSCHSSSRPGGDGDADSDVDGDEDFDCPPGVEAPSEEIMDGVDNDCDGRIDECTDPHCSRECVCTDGQWRYCSSPFCGAWGRQICEHNGRAWSECFEIDDIPEICVPVETWFSSSAETCCIEAGFCCMDTWDLDQDGDTWESLGNCPEVPDCPDDGY